MVAIWVTPGPCINDVGNIFNLNMEGYLGQKIIILLE